MKLPRIFRTSLFVYTLSYLVGVSVAVAVGVTWENVGVAPPYRDYRVAFQLRGRDHTPGEPMTLVTPTSIRGWLPGRMETELAVKIPESASPGRCQLAIGLVDPATRQPAVRLAIAGRDPQGWYPLSELDLQ